MLNTKVGYSQNANAFESGKETATMAKMKNAKVGLLFTSCVMDQREIVNGIRSVSSSHVVGCTSSAAICTQDGYLNAETGYTGMMSFGGDVKVGVAGSAKTVEPARAIGRRIAKTALKELGDAEPSFCFMTASPKEEEEYMLGIQDIVGTIPIFGGSAADNTVEEKWSIICDSHVFSDGCAICLFSTDAELQNLYDGRFDETDNVGIITEVKNDRTLVTIDGVPSVKKYCEWTGKSLDEVAGSNLLTATIFNPLGIKNPIGTVTAIRHPMFANEDLSMNIGANLATKTAVIQMHLDPQDMVKANPRAICELNKQMDTVPESYFLVHCGGRRLGLQLEGLEDQIYPTVKKVMGDKEFLMVFTFGEYGTGDHSANTVGGLSLSFTAFGK